MARSCVLPVASERNVQKGLRDGDVRIRFVPGMSAERRDFVFWLRGQAEPGGDLLFPCQNRGMQGGLLRHLQKSADADEGAARSGAQLVRIFQSESLKLREEFY